MNFQDILAQIQAQAKAQWERVQESSTYNKLRDRYENLTPNLQKLVILGSVLLGFLCVMLIPYSYLSSSSNYVEEFESKRNLIRELLKVSGEANQVPDLPKAPPNEMLRVQINENLKNNGIFPEQIKGIEDMPIKASLIPENLTQGGLIVHLAKLNFRQLLMIGTQLQDMSPSVKLKDMAIQANIEDEKYLDVFYTLVAFKVPDVVIVPMEPEKKGGRGNSKSKSSGSRKSQGSGDEDL